MRKLTFIFAALLSLSWGTMKAQQALPYSYGFEDYNLATDGWTKYFGTSLSKNNNECAIVGEAKKTGSYGFRFSSYQTSGANAQYLISPELNAPNGVNVSFYYKVSNASGTEKFKVGYSTTDTDVSNFTFGEEISTNSTGWLQYENSFPAGTKYVAIYYYANYQYRLYVDDFSFTSMASGPALAVADGSTTISSGYNYNFGLTTAGDTHYFILSNPGTESITLNIEATNGFGVSNSSLTLEAKGSSLLTVTMADATASGTVTITPTASEVDPFVINVSGTIRDANKVYLDFADGQIPDGWTSVAIGSYASSYGSAWAASTGYVSQSGSSSSYEWAFTSPLLTFAKDELIAFETEKYSSSTYYNPSIKVEYSLDGTSWTTIGSAYTDDVADAWTSRSVTIPVEGVKYIRFSGWYVKLRNIYGGQLPNGANFAIDTDGTTQSLGVAAIGGIAEKTFTITNSGNAALPVTFTDDTDFYVAKTIKFTKPTGWNGVNLYVWDSSNNAINGAWPGNAITTHATNDFSQEVYTATLPKGATGIIFSDNGNNQTSDISTEGFKDIIGYYLNGTTPTQWQNDNFSVPAKNGSTNGSASFTVRMATATTGAKSGNIELAFDALNATSFTIPVSGVVMPAGADVVDFNTAIPSTWENQDNGWSIYNNEAAKCNGKKNLTTQKLDFSNDENPFFVMMVKASDSGNGDYVTVEGSADNGTTWTAFEKKTYSYPTDFGASTADYSTIIVNIPNTVNKLRFNGYYVLIDQIVGLKYSNNDPKMGIYTDAECNTAVANASVTETKGFVTEAPAAITYYIKNVGTGTMNLTLADNVTGMTAALGATELTAGQSTSLTITKDETKGFFGGDAVVTAEGLGTFTVSVTGVLVDEDKLDLDFTTADIPATWTKNDWSKNSNGYAEIGYKSTPVAMESTTLIATAGETLVVLAKNTYNSSSYTFGVKYKSANDANAEWQDLIPAANIYSSDFQMLHGTIAETGNYLLQFNGNYAQIQRIYGLSKPDAPEMVIYDGEAVAGASHSFGKVTDENDATWTLTVKNEGETTLTGLAVALTGDNADHYTAIIEENKTELAKNETATITVTQLKDNLGAHSATLTISAEGLDSKEIALSGTTVDHTILNVDFDTSSAWPAEVLQHGANWSVYYSSYSNYGWAQQTSSSTVSSLILTPLTINASTDKLKFGAWKYSGSGSYHELNVRYTTDGGITWNDYDWNNYDWSSEQTLRQQLTTSEKEFEITGIPAGTVAFDFYGKYVRLDNITGDMKVAQAPLVTFTETANNIDGANLKADATATYTLANNGNADYVATVATTNVTAEVAGDDVTFAENTLTVPAGKTATITVTMAFAAPYGEKTGNLSITSESWVGDIAAEYAATLVDPTNFVEDFADGKPAGWYNGGWTISGGDAHIWAGTAKELITEKLGVEEGKNVLSFDAKVSNGSDEQTLNVYTSTDRETWSETQAFTLTSEVQNFKLTALAADSYVKFEASNAVIDNLTGVKKLALPAHDLYEVSHTMAATGIPGASYTASMTAVSLVANETMIAELWLKKGDNYTKVASLENEAMTVDISKTFTLTGSLPNEEGEYKMWITIKNSDNSAFINTPEIDFTLAHTTSLAISNFENAPAVQANDNNEYEGTFTVTVENTGSKPLAANEISVSLINNADAEGVFTKSLAGMLFVETSNGTVDIATDAKLGVWMWGASAGEWAEFTKVRDGFWCVDLKDNTGYIIVRQDPEKDFSLDDCWNKTGDIAFADGNLRSFTNWGEGKDMIFNAATFALTNGQTIPVNVTVSGTLTDGEDASISYKAKENVGDTYYGGNNPLSRSLFVTAAPVIVLDETVGTIASTGSNRKVTLARTFVKGWNTVCLPFAINDVEAFFGEDAKAYEFTDYTTNGELSFSTVTELSASYPYVVYVPEAITEPMTLQNITISSSDNNGLYRASNNVKFQGTYAPIAAGEWGASGVVYGLTPEGRIAKASATASIKGFRAYFDIPAGTEIKAISFDDIEDTISLIQTDAEENDAIYNLAGQRVQKMQKGINIINGKKILK